MKTPVNIQDRFIIIMAGGRGERFWPVSRERTPKQLLKLLGERSFLQATVDRVLPLVPLKNIFIITNEAQAAEVRKQLPKLPKANVVGRTDRSRYLCGGHAGGGARRCAFHDRCHGSAARRPRHSRTEEIPASPGRCL
ncbi:MAG: sugar phosphate nucleotidyltransferase [Verrucomicrobiota bacterium]